MSAVRPGEAGATRACPHCKATILESSAVCPACRGHLRFDAPASDAAQRFVPLQVEGTINGNDTGSFEYTMVVVIRNERDEEGGIDAQRAPHDECRGAERRCGPPHAADEEAGQQEEEEDAVMRAKEPEEHVLERPRECRVVRGAQIASEQHRGEVARRVHAEHQEDGESAQPVERGEARRRGGQELLRVPGVLRTAVLPATVLAVALGLAAVLDLPAALAAGEPAGLALGVPAALALGVPVVLALGVPVVLALGVPVVLAAGVAAALVLDFAGVRAAIAATGRAAEAGRAAVAPVAAPAVVLRVPRAPRAGTVLVAAARPVLPPRPDLAARSFKAASSVTDSTFSVSGSVAFTLPCLT